MAIKLIFSIVVIKKSEVLSRFPGGWDAWLKFNEDDAFGPCWFDDHLFARASMDPRCINRVVEKWEAAGFIGLDEISGEKVWIDFCIPEGNERCDWIDYLENQPSVFLVGTDPGAVSYPEGANPKKSDSK